GGGIMGMGSGAALPPHRAPYWGGGSSGEGRKAATVAGGTVAVAAGTGAAVFEAPSK
ncbi:unnamed protein product, partial [Closterium sp. NIES-54]